MTSICHNYLALRLRASGITSVALDRLLMRLKRHSQFLPQQHRLQRRSNHAVLSHCPFRHIHGNITLSWSIVLGRNEMKSPVRLIFSSLSFDMCRPWFDEEPPSAHLPQSLWEQRCTNHHGNVTGLLLATITLIVVLISIRGGQPVHSAAASSL